LETFSLLWSMHGYGAQGISPNQQKAKNENESANIIKNDGVDELFAFSCTSDLNALVTKLKIDKSTHDTAEQANTSALTDLVSKATSPSTMTSKQRMDER
jgi:hypothetical protein